LAAYNSLITYPYISTSNSFLELIFGIVLSLLAFLICSFLALELDAISALDLYCKERKVHNIYIIVQINIDLIYRVVTKKNVNDFKYKLKCEGIV
jgi:hypothetical protein